MPGDRPLTLLVVEDDASVQEIMSLMLADPGRHVVVAGNAAEAMSLACAMPIDVLLTDVVLPGISGERVAAMVQALQPGVNVVYFSGWPEHPRLADVGAAPILAKPFSREQLNAAIAAAVDQL